MTDINKTRVDLIIEENNKYEEMSKVKNEEELNDFVIELAEEYYSLVEKGLYDGKETGVKCLKEFEEWLRERLPDNSKLMQAVKYNIIHALDDNATSKNIADMMMRLTSSIGYTR